MTKEEKMVDLMKNKKAELVDIIVRKDDTEIALRKEVSVYKKEATELAESVKSLNNVRDELTKQNDDKDAKITELNQNIRGLIADNNGMQFALAKANTTVAEKTAELEKAETQLLEDYQLLVAARRIAVVAFVVGAMLGIAFTLFFA